MVDSPAPSGQRACAHKHARSGKRIFPLGPLSKIPSIDGGCKRATTDLATIDAWFFDPVMGLEQPLNIGISTDGCLCVDVDNKPGKNGDASFLALELRGIEFPPTYQQTSPNGRHLLYSSHVPIANSVEKIAPGIDIRGEGGYIVASGSVVEAGRYTDNGLPVAPAPQALIDLCGVAAPRSEIRVSSADVDEDAALKRYTDWLENHAPHSIKGSGGDQTAYLVACRGRDEGLSEALTRDAREISRAFAQTGKLDGLRTSVAANATALDRLRDELRDVGAEILRTANNGARLDHLRQQYRGLEVEVASLGRAMERDSAAAQKLEASMRAAGLSTEFGKGRAQLEAMSAELGRVQAELAGVRQSARNLFGGIGDVARSNVAVNAELSSLRQRNALIGATTELERVERGIVLGNYAAYSSAQLSHLRQLAAEYDAKQALLRVERERIAASISQRASIGTFASGALSAGGVSAIGGAAGAGIAVGAGLLFSSQQALEMERNASALAAVTGSLNSARSEMAFVREQAERLGIGITDMTRAWVMFEAASKGSSLEGEKARDVFLAVSEVAQRLNLQGPETEGALRAIGQMMSKGTVQAEELRGQLGDRLPGAFNIMARALGVTTSELGEMLKKGQVLSGEALPAFAAELRKTFGTDVNSRIGTTVSNFTRLANEIKLAASELGELVNKPLGNIAGKVAAELAQLRKNGENLDAFNGRADKNEGWDEFFARQRRLASLGTSPYEPRPFTGFDPFAKPTYDSSFYGPGKPSSSTPLDLTAGVTPIDQENLAKLREQLATLGMKTELEKVEWDILNGELATHNKIEQSYARQIAIKQDALNATKAAKKADKLDDRSLAESDKMFRESLEAEARLIADREKLKRQLNIETLEAQGLDTQAALAKLRDQYDAFTTNLAGSAEGLDLANKWFNANEAKIALEAISREAQKALSDLQARIEARNLQAASASPTERRRLQAENASDVAATRASMAASVDRGALLGGESDRAFVEGVADRKAAIDNMAESIRRASEGPIKQLFRDWEDGTARMEEAGAHWLDDISGRLADFILTGKFGFKELADSIIAELTRIAVQQTIANAAAGAMSGGGGLWGAVAGGFAGIFSGGGAGSISSSGVVERANMPAGMFAEGGYISGPGTSTSDSIPAWLSDGEFVMNAKAVRMFGRETFERLNQGFKPPATRRYAEGGYVGRGGMSADAIAAGGTVNYNFAIQAPNGTVSRATQLQIAAAAASGAARASRRNN